MNQATAQAAANQAPAPLLIDGQWIAESGATLDTVNPATGQPNRRIAAATAALVDQAVKSAEAAARRPNWRDLLPHERARLLAKLADRMEAQVEDTARLQMQDNGKVLSECRAQARGAVATFRYYAAACETMESAMSPSRGNYMAMTTHEPYGVVAAITPWNSPLTMEAQKVAPALAAGNAVVLKPSEVTPSGALALGRMALEAGLPPGVLNVLPGTGAQAGSALVAHPGVRMISFTGGTVSGRLIAQQAGSRLVPVILELGGKSPHIVFEDADQDRALKEVAGGIFEGSGQSCVAGSRLFVQRSIFDGFLRRLTEHARTIKLGLPDVAGSQMGPIATYGHREKIESMVATAVKDGGQVHTGARRPADAALQAGFYYEPTIISGLDPNSSLAQQEVFGPVLCAIPFDNEDDLIAQANNSEFGLAAGIWTKDSTRAWRVARALEAGMVWINTYKQLSIATPFGGYKNSGIGREKGLSGLRAYQQSKSMIWGLG
ncbi:MAG: aldehyde dehydrogenase [Burkholderiaceae bacterium]|nr:aldehyde dehydrogenase [Burkholderiaceae bacterium]MDO9089186.1 aldehyde dehydrogenase [Burkholderiaceae bacterium]